MKVGKEQQKLLDAFQSSLTKEADLKSKVSEKVESYKKEISELEEKVVKVDKQKKDREQKLQKVEEPIKKLLDDKQAMQKKLTQAMLDSCSKFLSKHSNEDIVFIMQNLVAILRGQTSSDAFSVEIYLKKVEGFNLALNRIDYKAQSVGHVKNLLRELVGVRAKNLGIVEEKAEGEYVATGIEFPKNLIDFLIFYKLLIIVCKLCIAKHDEGLITEAIRRCDTQLDELDDKITSLKMKQTNLVNIDSCLDDGSGIKELIGPFEEMTKGIQETSDMFVAELK